MAKTDKNMFDTMEAALEKAESELSYATYLEESGSNAGIRKINANKADWLRWVVYLAKRGLELEKPCEQVKEDVSGPRAEDSYIAELATERDTLRERLKSLQISYDCEVEYRKALANRAKIDWCTEIIKLAHERCWLDGTVLVTPVEYLDRCLLELIKE